MSDTKSPFADCTKRSPKIVFDRYMEGHGCKCVHQLSQYGPNPNSREISLVNFFPKIDAKSDFLSILYSKATKVVKNPFSIFEIVLISKYNLIFRKVYIPQFTRKFAGIVKTVFLKTYDLHRNR